MSDKRLHEKRSGYKRKIVTIRGYKRSGYKRSGYKKKWL